MEHRTVQARHGGSSAVRNGLEVWKVVMKFLMLALFISLPLIAPNIADADAMEPTNPDALLAATSQLVDDLNSGELAGAQQRIEALADTLADLRASTKNGSVQAETLNLAADDLSGAGEFLLRS